MHTADIGLDGVEFADKPQTLFRNRGGAGGRYVDQLATSMGPAIGELDTRADATGRNQPVISGIAIHLQDAAKALQASFGRQPTPPGGTGDGHNRGGGATPGRT